MAKMISSVLLLCMMSSAWGTPLPGADDSYGVIVDAGSSGSRARVFNWQEGSGSAGGIPDIKETWNYKVRPGISSYVGNIEGLDGHVKDLLERAKQQIPQDEHKDTPIFFMATAGMRLLVEGQADAIMARVDAVLSDPDVNPFRFRSGQSRILSGEEEAAFAWIAVNYLRGYFSGTVANSVGILELGGASTQIAFVPAGILLAGKFPLSLAGNQYALYTHSYLHYGQELVALWIKEYLQDADPESDTLDNPCMLKDDPTGQNQLINGKTVSFRGIGDPDACDAMLDKLVYDAEASRCFPKPCAIGTVYQPTIDETKDFFAVSAFVLYPEHLDVLGEDGTVVPSELRDAARNFCRMGFAEGKEKSGERDEFVSQNCLMSLYLPRLLQHGYGFAPDTDQVKAFKEINNQPVEWSLGAMIYENEKEMCRLREG